MSALVSLTPSFPFGPVSEIIFKKNKWPAVHVWSIHDSWPEGKSWHLINDNVITASIPWHYLLDTMFIYVTFQYRFIFGTMVVYVMTLTQVIWSRSRSCHHQHDIFFSKRPNEIWLVFLVQIWFYLLWRYYYNTMYMHLQ